MFPSLLEQFIVEECTPDVVRMVTVAIHDETLLRPHFEFNRFELTIDRETNTALLSDILGDTDEYVQRVPLNELEAAIAAHIAAPTAG